jgi:hypothetical protein
VKETREVKSIVAESAKVKSHGKSESRFIVGEKGHRFFLNGSQAPPVCPCDEDSVNV